jgi:hypothetical protein
MTDQQVDADRTKSAQPPNYGLVCATEAGITQPAGITSERFSRYEQF